MVKNKDKNFVSAVIYIHNSEKYLAEFVKAIIEVMQNNFEHSEIICVNDQTDDGSIEIVKGVSQLAVTTSISVLNLSYFHGLEVAMNAGVDLAIGDFVFEFDDSVLDFDVDIIMDVYYRSLAGYDVVSAVPRKKERFTSKMFYRIFDRYSKYQGRMTTEKFRVLSRRVINRIDSMNRTVPYRKVLYANNGLKTEKIYYLEENIKKDFSDKREQSYRKELAVDSLILFTDLGYRFSITMTIIMMLISVFMIVYSFFIYLLSQPVAGWTTTIFFLSIAFFGLFGILTIIIKYLQLLINLSFKKTKYNFENIEKLTK